MTGPKSEVRFVDPGHAGELVAAGAILATKSGAADPSSK
jgi:hypothetical protein